MEIFFLAFHEIRFRVLCFQCDACTRLKQRAGSRYKHFTLKDISQEIKPWDTVNFDSVVLWSFVDHAGNKRMLTALTIIEPSTRLFETCRIKNSTSLEASQLFDVNWICRYPKSHVFICDQDYEFKIEFKELYETHNLTRVPSSRSNPQRNEIIERTHLELLSMLRAL